MSLKALKAGLSESSSGTGSSNLLTGRLIYVDDVNGNNATAVSGNASKPYLTLVAAKAAAVSGDLVWVRPGSYTVTDSILKNGVNWNFMAGASVGRTITGAGTLGIIDDGNSAITCNVFGDGDFLLTLTGSSDYCGCVTVQNSASVITVNARTIGATQGAGKNGIPIGVYTVNGTVRVTASHSIYANDISINTDSGIAIYWIEGLTIVRVPTIYATNNAVWTANAGSGADNLYVDADEIYTTGSANSNAQWGCITGFSGTNSNAAIWIRAGTIRANVGSGNISVFANSDNANKIYVQCQKLFGPVIAGGGLVYVDADKGESVANVASQITSLFATCSGGTLRYNVRHHDPKAFTGDAFVFSGGTFISNEIEYTSGSGSNGLNVSSGTVRISTAYLNTVANTAGNPITKSGGVLVLNASTLVSQGSNESINAGNAQNVVAMGCWANNVVNGNVAIITSGGLTVDTNVV